MEIAVTDHRLFRISGGAGWLDEILYDWGDDGHDNPLTLQADIDMIMFMQHRAANQP